MYYAYVKNGVVVDVEKRTEQFDNENYPIQRFYHASLLPFFIPIPEDIKHSVRVGWIHSQEKGFHEPKPFEINNETGEMYLPAAIPAKVFWQVYQDNLELREQLAVTADIVDTMLVEQLMNGGLINE